MRIRLSYFIVLLSSLPRAISNPSHGSFFHRGAYFTGVAVLCLLASVLCQPAFAGGMSSLHSLESGSISITNTQKNSSWVPVALLFRFDAPASGTIIVERNTGSTTFQLTTVDLSDNLSAVWTPKAPITFNLNDVLGITTTATNGTVEIIRKAD